MGKLFSFLLILSTALAACAENPLRRPLAAIGAGGTDPAFNRTRGQVEIFVKTNHPALMRDIAAGGGATLSRGFDLAQVPAPARAMQTLRLQSDAALYSRNLDALTAALMIFSVA